MLDLKFLRYTVSRSRLLKIFIAIVVECVLTHINRT